jgi:hypothetical protein
MLQFDLPTLPGPVKLQAGQLVRRCAHLTLADFEMRGQEVIIHLYRADPTDPWLWDIVCDECHRAGRADLSSVFPLPEDVPETALA